MPSLRAVVHACSAGVLVLAAACADSTSPRVQPLPGGEGPASLRLVCRAEVATRTVACAAPGAAEGVRADRIVGQGGGIKLTSSNIAVVADSFMFDVTVTNQLEYPVGTTDGLNADPNGIRVFFVDGIHTTQGTGSVTVANADGVGVFTAAGQAYFAYPGVLQPAATTAPRRWKLRFEPGVESFSFGLYVSVPVPPGGGSVWMTFLAPAANSVVGDSVVVRVRVDSASAPVLSVKASAAGRSVMLAPVSPGVVTGTLQLAGLPAGPIQLRVHAVTQRADTGDVVRPLTKDSPPTLVVSAPVRNTVASPNLRIDFDCVDDAPAGCASVTARVLGASSSALLASGTTGIHLLFSLAGFEEQQPTIELKGVDSRGQARIASVPVYVESGDALVFVDSAGSGAMDLDSARLLFFDAAGRAWLRDRGTGSRTLAAEGVGTAYGWLHPAGAIFATPSIGGHVYDWRSGALFDLGKVNSSSSLVAKGGWAIWSDGLVLTRRDLAAGTNATVYTQAGSIQNDVAENGDVVFWSRIPLHDVYRYRGGGLTAVTADPDSLYWNVYPVTDGTNVVYLKSAQHGQTVLEPGRVTLWDGTAETVLSDASSDARYAVNAGWTAYQVTDGVGTRQIRTRAPDGTLHQVTNLLSHTVLRTVGPDGTVVYSVNSSLYVIRAPYGGSPTRLGLNWLRPSFKGTELLLFLGNTVFRASY